MLKTKNCPKCGELNPVNRSYCYICAADLNTPSPEPKAAPEHTCFECCQASIHPPLGERLHEHDVWCGLTGAAVDGRTANPACFSEIASWGRTETVG